MINIKGLDKAELLVELYNHSHQQGFGMFQRARNLTVEDAREMLKQSTYFDYLYGKVMKVDLSSDEELNEFLYDRDNGPGAAQAVVDEIRKKMQEKEKTSETQVVETPVAKNEYNFGTINNNDKNVPKVEKNYIELNGDYDLNFNLDDKGIEKGTLFVDVTDTYIGIYKEEKTDEHGRYITTFRLGLFKKGKVMDIPNRGKGWLHEVQTYEDVLSGNTAALWTNGNREDITGASEYVVESMRPYQPLSADYNVGNYSSGMERLREEYGNGLEDFSATIIGAGLVSYEKFAPEQKGNVPLKDVLTTLMKFNSMTISEERYKKIAEPKKQEQILNSLKSSAKFVVDQRYIPNDIDLSHLPEDFNTIKRR